MGKIHILEDYIANQIAAGEVVERPASVVKELVENSIDGNSKKIVIEIIDSGLTAIKVSDNGEGMNSEDCKLAFFRHATSKIKKERDLFNIITLGFRGEALASIASVAKVTCKSSPDENGIGTKLQLEKGEIIREEIINWPKGTEILVTDLFYNTPARLKFMKSEQTELNNIINIVQMLSIGHPQISFILKNHEKTIYFTAGDNKIKHVLQAIYGNENVSYLLELKAEDQDFRITGFFSKPELTRSNRSYIHLFLNGRYIKNQTILNTIIKSYGTLLMTNRFPIAILNIEADPMLFDVNVHPTKLEVRISKEKELINLIEAEISKLLKNNILIHNPLNKLNQSTNSLTLNTNQPAFNFSYEVKDELKINSLSKNIGNIILKEDEAIKQNNELISDKEIIINTTNINNLYLEVIGQYRGTYILAQGEDGLFLIDQHAAHERINYEKNIKNLKTNNEGKQILLTPIIFELNITELNIILSSKLLLENYGIEIEAFGQTSIIVRTIPNWIKLGEEKIILDKIFNQLIKKQNIEIISIRDEAIAGASCKSSIKANQFMSKPEMESLLIQLMNCENPYSCPHGRPTMIRFTNYDIEKMFKRVI